MNPLEQFAQQHPHWSLEEFVQIANQLLPQFLPQADASDRLLDARVQEEINPRLVRYYTTQTLIDKPLKQGREARYTYRHLLQLLVVRRLLMEGLTASAIGSLVAAKSNTELEALLHGGMQLTVEAANPALAFLQQVQTRTAPTPNAPLPAAPPSAMRSPLPPPASPPSSSWVRIDVLPGLEIHVREDFTYPSSSHEQQNLLQIIAQHLAYVTRRKKSL